jgi:hypothetical protein
MVDQIVAVGPGMYSAIVSVPWSQSVVTMSGGAYAVSVSTTVFVMAVLLATA